ncbi:MAG TPA: transcriptional repressor [Nitrospiria bacterium]|jgi:Fur family peroxide stress response transcriptional regulator
MKEQTINVSEEFKKHGLKLTHQRLAVYEALKKSKDHPSPEEIYQSIKGDYPMLSRNTIYTTLETLKGLGLITEVNPWHQARYDANLGIHHHVVCVKCKRIDDIHEPTLDQILIPDSIKGKYDGLSHKVEFSGVCPKCYSENRTKVKEKS